MVIWFLNVKQKEEQMHGWSSYTSLMLLIECFVLYFMPCIWIDKAEGQIDDADGH